MNSITPLPLVPEWWVVLTRDGYKTLPYASNTDRRRPVGPFSCRMTADLKRDELAAKRRGRRAIWRSAAASIAIATGMAVVYLGPAL